MYLLIEIENNEIGVEGCQFISKSKWLKLTAINLSKNN